MDIGPYTLTTRVVAAPMAGVTDLPFRQLCRSWGAGLAVSEMISADAGLRSTLKSRQRTDHTGELEPVAVQIVGADPLVMAEAARFNADSGAQIIDINMGCPAKKVCNKSAGSALLQDLSLVTKILRAVVNAVPVPVTLKIRTGPEPANRNGVEVAKIAESEGIAAVAIHGRTRQCKFRGEAEFETIRAVRRSVSIPVIANGDVDTPEKAARVLDFTGADAVMIGRAAQGKPWLFHQVDQYLQHRTATPDPDIECQRNTFLDHLQRLYQFYGDRVGVRVARKHVSWYLQNRSGGAGCWQAVRTMDDARAQYRTIADYFEQQIDRAMCIS